eukprot:6461320-Amphidinium_carterae.1
MRDARAQGNTHLESPWIPLEIDIPSHQVPKGVKGDRRGCGAHPRIYVKPADVHRSVFNI